MLLGYILSTEAASWKFIAMGDTRGTGTTDAINVPVLTEIANEIVSQNPDFVIVVGDLVYSGAYTPFYNWKTIMSPVYQAGIPVMPVLGNHDVSDINSYLTLFKNDVPTNGPSGETYRTFAFYHKNVLMIGMDNYVTSARVNQTWLNQILSQNKLPHVFVYAHQPAFKANHADCMDDYPIDRDIFWNSLITNKCKIYFCGHDHFYDRLKAGGIYQMIVGNGGAPIYTSYSYNGNNSSWSPVNQYHSTKFGYTLITIDDLTVTISLYERPDVVSPPTSYIKKDTWTYTLPSSKPTSPTNLRISSF